MVVLVVCLTVVLSGKISHRLPLAYNSTEVLSHKHQIMDLKYDTTPITMLLIFKIMSLLFACNVLV